MLNLQGLRLGMQSALGVYQNLHHPALARVEKINLADNQITDGGMSSITTLLSQNPRINSLNLASNMISGEGLETCLPELISNASLAHLDLGVIESSVRKNSLGMQGAVCISSLLMRN